MLPDRVSNPGPLTYESGALPIALRGPAKSEGMQENVSVMDVRCEKKNPSLEITVRLHLASLMMPNSDPQYRKPSTYVVK